MDVTPSRRPGSAVPKTGPKSRTLSARLIDDPHRALAEDTIVLCTDFEPPTPLSPLPHLTVPKAVVPIPRFEKLAVSTPPPVLPSGVRRSERIMDKFVYTPCD